MREGSRARGDAKRLLVHYLRMAVEAKGFTWHGENHLEAEGIVDLICEAVHEEIALAEWKKEQRKGI